MILGMAVHENEAKAASRNSLSAQVRDYIEAKIATGELGSGDRLVEARIANELRVSSIPVREAIRELVAKGILEYVVYKGVRVREVSMAETVDALQVKAVLEGLAARLAGPRLIERIPVLTRCLSEIRKNLRIRDYVGFQTQNQNFHRNIVESSGNQILLRLWDSLAFEVRTRFLIDYLKGVDPAVQEKEHADLLAAVSAGDTERVARLSIDHSRHLVEHLEKRMAENAKDEKVNKTNPEKGTRSTS